MPNELVVDVSVYKAGALTFVPADAINLYDNESPDINGDGLQLYVANDFGGSAWVLVPEPSLAEQGAVRARLIDGWDSPLALRAAWHQIDGGWAIRVRIPVARDSLRDRELVLGVVVNEKPPHRERRRGQLVLGGASGEFVYLRGDREDRDRLPRFTITG